MQDTGVAKQWVVGGFSCAIWTDPPGQVWADFVHDVDELALLIEGEIKEALKFLSFILSFADFAYYRIRKTASPDEATPSAKAKMST